MASTTKCVQFGVFTADNIRAFSAVEITTASTRGNPDIEKTPYDLRLGSLENGAKCETCREEWASCPGHFGHIELAEHCYNPEHIEKVCGILECICMNCISPRISENVAGIILQRMTRFRAYKKKAKVLKQCSQCQEPLPNFFIDKQTIKYFFSDKKTAIPITAREAYSILVQISSKTMKLLGFNEDLSQNDIFTSEDIDLPEGTTHIHEVRPEGFIFEALPVIPTCARPFVMRGSEKKDDDITDRYNAILKINARLKADSEAPVTAKPVKSRKKIGKMTEADRKKAIQDLQNNIWTLIDNSKEGKSKSNSRQLKGYRERLSTKEGHIQANCAGKRVDFTARTVVVGAGPDLPMGWIGVPETIAKKVTIAELVTSWNIGEYERLLAEGKINIVKRQGNTIRVHEATKGGTLPFTWKGEIGLKPHDVVDRQLRDGDWVILNRQPTLRIESMQGVQIKVLIGEYVFRIPLGMTRPFNMDFDGDECNIHIAQSQGGRIECSIISRTASMIVSGQNNAPVMGCVQNTLICMYMLTETFATPEDPRATGEIQKSSKMMAGRNTGELSIPGYETFVDTEDFMASIEAAGISSQRFRDLLFRAKVYYPKYIKGDISDPESLKLASKVPGKILASVVFPRTFTWERKTEINERMPEVKIKNGIILPESGPLEKKTIGGTAGSSIHALWKISPDTATRMISECQFISSIMIARIGFSMGVSDSLPTRSDEVKAAVAEALIKCEMINASDKDTYDKEREINGALNEAMGIAPRLAKTSMNKGDRNALVIMQKSGAKGSIANNGQISGFVGQQNIDGKRMPFALSNGTRTLPHFIFGDNSPEARGFVDRSYLEGLNFKQVWFHAGAGRRGVIDTAMKTADSGYIQKKIVKKVEDCKTWDDGTLRDLNGIVQFLYGGDGFDAKELIPCKGLDFPFFCNPHFIASTLISEAEYARDQGEDIGTLRVMTKNEMDMLCSFIHTGCPGVQTEVTERSTFNVRTILRAVISNVKIYDSVIARFCKSIKDEFEQAKAKYGYMAGLVAGHSIGEPTTQLTLNSFHSTGMSAKDVTLGVPKLKEILNASTKPSKPTCTVYHNDPELKSYELEELNAPNEKEAKKASAKALIKATEIANGFTQLTVDFFMSSHELQYLSLPDDDPETIDIRSSPLCLLTYEEYEKRWWVTLSEDFGRPPLMQPDGWVIVIQLDITKLYTYGITPQDIADAIEADSFGNRGNAMACVASPTNIGQIEVYLNFSDIQPFAAPRFENAEYVKPEFSRNLLTEDNINYFTARDVALELIRKTKVQGIKGITKTYVRQDQKTKEWIIDTQGTNLVEILAHAGVDTTRTLSDDIWEVFAVGGIEAVRAFLIEDVTRILSFDGTYINPRHIGMLIDTMCRTGTLTSVNRDGIPREVGPLAKGMFEKAVDNFGEAAAFAEHDTMRGVSAAVMYGTLPEVGTGTVCIKDADKLPAIRVRKPVKIPSKKRGGTSLSATKKKK